MIWCWDFCSRFSLFICQFDIYSNINSRILVYVNHFTFPRFLHNRSNEMISKKDFYLYLDPTSLLWTNIFVVIKRTHVLLLITFAKIFRQQCEFLFHLSSKLSVNLLSVLFITNWLLYCRDNEFLNCL